MKEILNNSDDSLNYSNSLISHSGNSKVDVIVQIDTKPIALAMLYTLFSTKQLSGEELEKAIKHVEKLSTNNYYSSTTGVNDVSKVKLFTDDRLKYNRI